MTARGPESRSDGLLVGGLSLVGGLAAASVARRTARVTWKSVTGTEPPDDPTSRDTDWVVALLWAVSTGAAVGVARLMVERGLVARFATRGRN